MTDIDLTHDPRRQSWVGSANGHPDFPIQNLPLGVFSPAGGAPRGGIAIGDEILDLPAVLELGLFEGSSGEAARFLEDGDEVILRAYAEREGYARIGFGECRGTIAGAE
jgi:fumarylacetoacetase